MHELGIMTGVLQAVEESAKQAGSEKVLKICLSVRVKTETIEDALRFAFEALSEGTMCESAELEITMIPPVSICAECGNEYELDRFHMFCPECGSSFTQLIQGKELQIDSIEVDLPDDGEDAEEPSQLSEA